MSRSGTRSATLLLMEDNPRDQERNKQALVERRLQIVGLSPREV